MRLKCKVIKKVAPLLLHLSPFQCLSPSLAKKLVPSLSNSIFGSFYPTFNTEEDGWGGEGGGEGGGEVVRLTMLLGGETLWEGLIDYDHSNFFQS